MNSPLVISLQIQATKCCNLNCAYCYSDKNSSQSVSNMSPFILKKILSLAYDNNEFESGISITLQGGEPLLAGQSFFKCLAKLLSEYRSKGKTIEIDIRTNGTLINSFWVSLFRELECNVMISLDGSQNCHDRVRVDVNGAGTYYRVIEGIEFLVENNIAAGISMTLTNISINDVDSFYEHARYFKIPLHLQPFVPEGRGRHLSNSFLLEQGQYAKSFLQLAEKWLWDNDGPEFPALKNIAKYLATSDNSISTESTCSQYLAFGPSGECSPCFRLLGHPEYIIGNVFDFSLGQLASIKARNICFKRSNIAKCRNCTYSKLCGGGCAHNALVIGGNQYLPDYYCDDYLKIYSWIKDKLLIITKQKLHSFGDL